MQVAVTYRKIEYYVEMVDLVMHLQNQEFDLVYNRESRTIDIRSPTLIGNCTNLVGFFKWDDLGDADFEWLKGLQKSNTNIEFVKKHANKVQWIGGYTNTKIK